MPTDYDMDMPGDETPGSMAPPADAPPEMHEDGDKKTVLLSADMLGGMMPSEGQKIMFCVTKQPDSEGNITGYWEALGEGMDGKSGEKDWETEFREEMSPRNKMEDEPQ